MIKAMMLTVYLANGSIGGQLVVNDIGDFGNDAWSQCHVIAEAVIAQAGTIQGGLRAECEEIETGTEIAGR